MLNRTQNVDSRGKALIRIFFKEFRKPELFFLSYWWCVFIASDKTELKLDSLKKGNLLSYATEKFGGIMLTVSTTG